MGFLGLFCCFLIEQAIPKSDRACLGGLDWRALCLRSRRTRRKHFAGSSVQFENPLMALLVPHCVTPCARQRSAAGAVSKRNCALVSYLVIFSSHQLNGTFGNPAAVGGFFGGVSAVPSGGSGTTGAFPKKRAGLAWLPAHLPYSLSHFRAKR